MKNNLPKYYQICFHIPKISQILNILSSTNPLFMKSDNASPPYIAALPQTPTQPNQPYVCLNNQSLHSSEEKSLCLMKYSHKKSNEMNIEQCVCVCVFIYSKSMTNFEDFCWNISTSMFLKSEFLPLYQKKRYNYRNIF